jgi:hypothetical protein
MHGIGLDEPLQKWFEHKAPKTKIAPDFIEQVLLTEEAEIFKPNSKVIFVGNMPKVSYYTKFKKGFTKEMATFSFETKKITQEISIPKEEADWLVKKLAQLSIHNEKQITLQQLKNDFENEAGLEDFEIFWFNKPMNGVYKVGLLSL